MTSMPSRRPAAAMNPLAGVELVIARELLLEVGFLLAAELAKGGANAAPSLGARPHELHEVRNLGETFRREPLEAVEDERFVVTAGHRGPPGQLALLTASLIPQGCHVFKEFVKPGTMEE